MYSPYTSGSGHQNDPSYQNGTPAYHPQQPYATEYQYTQGYQTLRPPPLNTGHSPRGNSMKRTSSNGSTDSGYATRAPSVASSTLHQSYPIQSHDYAPSRHPSQQSSSYSYSNQVSPEIEVIRAAPEYSSKQKKMRRLSTPSPSSPSEYPCLYASCGHISSQAHDLKRHMAVHIPPPPEQLLDCKYKWCGRVDAHGFKREDHRKEHYRKVHIKEPEYSTCAERSGRRRKSLRRPPSAAASTTHLSANSKNNNTPMQTKPADRKSTVREESVAPSGELQASGLSMEAVARLGNLQLPNTYENSPDQETTGLKVSVPDLGSAMPAALEANNVGPINRRAPTSDNVVIQSYKASELGSCSDDENVHERLEDGILGDLGPGVECDYSHPTETVLDGNETLIASLSRNSKKDKLAVIKSQVLETLSVSEAGQYCASLMIQWDILGFMKDQFRDNEFTNTALGPVITISGSAQHAQATTCSEYIRKNWPAHGLKTLDALQDALDSPTQESQLKITARDNNGSVSGELAPPSHADLVFDVTQERPSLNIKSRTPDIIVEVVQQLAWMGAALRTSRDGRIQYCESKLEGVLKAKGVKTAIFNLTFAMSWPDEEEQSCWFPLFTNPVIAHGFPTAPRNDHELGLEVPLAMMAALGGARHAVDFEGGLVLKGYSTLFVPMRRHKESVQWHLIRARGENRIPYREASLQFPNRALLKDLNHEALKDTRAYLGWWKEAEIHLGTIDADYESIDWSTAKEAGPSPRLTGGTLGFSKMISAQVTFVLGAKDGFFHNSQQEPFQKIIDRTENLPVILYDQKDRRAWLVPALQVILHIIQLRNHIKPFVVGGSKVQISPLDPSRQGRAARDAINKNKSQKLFDCESNEEKEYCFRDAVLDTWSILDRLMEREATTQATPGIAVHATLQSTLYGWELRAVADEDRHLRQKAQVLEKTAGRWYDLVKDVDAVVLFASGLGDVIKPRSDLDGLCQKWRSLPMGKDYLAVCVSMLETFYLKAGHRHDHQYLTSAKLQWHRGSTLFEQCAGVASNCYKCDRLQQVYHDSYKIIGRRIPPGNLEANGCVVFGQAHHSMKPIPKPSTKSSSLYTLSNDQIDSSNVSRSSSMPEDLVVPPGLVDHSERPYNGNDSTRTPSPESPRSPIWGNNNGFLKPKVRRRRLPHPDTASVDRDRHIGVAMQKATSPSHPEDWAEQKNNASVKDTNGCVMETKRTRRPNFAYHPAPMTIPEIDDYRNPRDSCQHLNGCFCRSRFMVNLESRQAFEHTSTTNGSQKTSSKIVG